MACVASVSSRGSSRKLGQEQKMRMIFFCFRSKKEVCCACKFTEVMWQTVCVYLKLSFSFISVDIAKDLLYNYPREFASI